MTTTPPIANIAVPSKRRAQQTYVTEVVQARERLFEAERAIDDSKNTTNPSYALSSLALSEEATSAALAHITGALAWLPAPDYGRALRHGERAIKAALAHIRIYHGWLTDDGTEDRRFVGTQVQRSRSHALAAVTAARAEVHRALDLLTRTFPDAAEIEAD